jgi:hypothetical protein
VARQGTDEGRQRVARRLRGGLSERLKARQAEIEEAILARVFSVADLPDAPDPAYLDGLRTAVCSALDYAISDLKSTDSRPAPVPAELFAQARHAARNGVSLDVVLRRYFAGYTLLSDFLIREVESDDSLGAQELHRITRAQAELFDRLIEAVAAEYRSESEAKSRSRHRRLADCVAKLLAGELADTFELEYDLHAWHVGMVVVGPAAEQALRKNAETLDRRLLLVSRDEETHWAWLGGRRRAERVELDCLAAAAWPPRVSVTIGEPGNGVAGWRHTHRQAAAALPVALRGPGALTRYSDVALLASMLQDEVLVTSLQELYLTPLEAERDGGETLRQTLRAYFASERNVSSAAAVLGVNRNTVSSRLRAIEVAVRRPLSACGAELEAALRLSEQQHVSI